MGKSRKKVSDKLFCWFIGLAFIAMGLGFTVRVWREVTPGFACLFWKKVPCEILSQEVTWVPDPPSSGRALFSVRYRYTLPEKVYKDQIYEGHLPWPGYAGSENFAEAYRLTAAYPVGRPAVCQVNPDNPQEAALSHPDFSRLAKLLFPLLFILIGTVPIVITSLPPSARTHGQASETAGAYTLLAFSGIPLTFAVVLLFPAWEKLWTSGWQPTSCTILASDLVTHVGRKGGRSYSVQVVYRYEFASQTYLQNHYWFPTYRSSGYNDQKRRVNALPVGQITTCFVNPQAPWEAVMDRSLPWETWFGVFCAVLFALMLFGAHRFIKKQTILPHKQMRTKNRSNKRFTRC